VIDSNRIKAVFEFPVCSSSQCRRDTRYFYFCHWFCKKSTAVACSCEQKLFFKDISE